MLLSAQNWINMAAMILYPTHLVCLALGWWMQDILQLQKVFLEYACR